MTDGTYFDRLVVLLREREVPQERIDELVRELTGYAEEAGADAAEEFGSVAELATQLSERDSAGATGPGGSQLEPDDAAEAWVWTADAFKEQRLLDRFGGQGWEVDRLDRLGRFVCRRDLGHPMRWEYRRETLGHSGRSARSAQLAPEGWEQFGVWGPFTYYKRSGAVLDGPAARIDEPPAPPAKRVHFGKWLFAWLAVCVLAVASAFWSGVTDAGIPDGSTLAGACVGFAVAGLAVWLLGRSALRKQTSGRR